MNRITAHINSLKPRIEALTPAKRDALDEAMSVEPFEHFAFQEAQARAHAMGKLTVDEAMVVYSALGEAPSESNGGWTADTDLATKVTVTKLMAELIRR